MLSSYSPKKKYHHLPNLYRLRTCFYLYYTNTPSTSILTHKKNVWYLMYMVSLIAPCGSTFKDYIPQSNCYIIQNPAYSNICMCLWSTTELSYTQKYQVLMLKANFFLMNNVKGHVSSPKQLLINTQVKHWSYYKFFFFLLKRSYYKLPNLMHGN